MVVQAEVGRALLRVRSLRRKCVGLCEGEAAHIGLWSSSGTHVLVPALPPRPPAPPLSMPTARNETDPLTWRTERDGGGLPADDTTDLHTERDVNAASREKQSRLTHAGSCPLRALQELGASAAARASGTHYARVGQEVPTDDTNLSPRLAGPRVPALYRQTRLCGEMPARRSRACVAGRLGRDSILWRCLFVGDDPRAAEEAARLYTGGQAQRVPLR